MLALNASLGALPGALEQIRGLGLPVGWESDRASATAWPPRLQPGQSPWLACFGWLVTIMAVSLGSKFWYQVLNETLQLRRGDGTQTSANRNARRRTG